MDDMGGGRHKLHDEFENYRQEGRKLLCVGQACHVSFTMSFVSVAYGRESGDVCVLDQYISSTFSFSLKWSFGGENEAVDKPFFAF